MAYATTIDDGFPDVQPIPKPGSTRITAGFNAALFAFQAASGFLGFLSSERARRASIENILLSSTLDLGRLVVVMLITAFFIRVFWERFIATVVAVRPIDSREALAIALMIGLIVGR